MPKGYHHLTQPERCQIYALRKSGLSQGAVARRLGRCPSVISREIRRNSGERGYRHAQARRKAEERRRAASSVPRKLTPDRVAWGRNPPPYGPFRGVPCARAPPLPRCGNAPERAGVALQTGSGEVYSNLTDQAVKSRANGFRFGYRMTVMSRGCGGEAIIPARLSAHHADGSAVLSPGGLVHRNVPDDWIDEFACGEAEPVRSLYQSASGREDRWEPQRMLAIPNR